jgi:hypothetical protein
MGQTYTGMNHIPPFFEDADLNDDGGRSFAHGGMEGSNGVNGMIVIYYYDVIGAGGAP